MNPKSIEERLDDIDAQLKTIRQLLNYVIVELGSSEEEARAFEAGMQQAEYEAGMEEAEEEFAARQALEFAAWSKDEEAKGRPRKESTFENFIEDSGNGEGNGEQQ